jgi:hypothetical protein
MQFLWPALALSVALPLASFSSPGPQVCGSNVTGGTIQSGFYAGVGDSCEEAKEKCKTTGVGVTAPDCAGCPPGSQGCEGSAHFDESKISFGACLWDPAMHKYVIVGQIQSNTRWFKACAPCTASH